jgi:lipopolysaccharide assembly protein A
VSRARLAEAATRAAGSVSWAKETFPVRWFYLAVVVVFVAALIIFVFQNTQSVGVSFLALGATLPLAVLVFVVYLLGALSGGSLYALLRRSLAGSRRA